MATGSITVTYYKISGLKGYDPVVIAHTAPNPPYGLIGTPDAGTLDMRDTTWYPGDSFDYTHTLSCFSRTGSQWKEYFRIEPATVEDIRKVYPRWEKVATDLAEEETDYNRQYDPDAPPVIAYPADGMRSLYEEFVRLHQCRPR